MRTSWLLALGIVLSSAALPALARPRDGAARRARRARYVAVRITRDLDRRGSDAWDGKSPRPQGGLTSDGDCADGRRAARIPLFIPPPGSADMFTDIAFVCRSTRQYWVHRTGGFIGTDEWIGPFDVPPRLRGDGPRPRS